MITLFRAIVSSLQRFGKDDCSSHAAAMAYYTIFSLPPLLVIILMIAGALGFSKQEVDRIIQKDLGIPGTDTVRQGGVSDSEPHASTANSTGPMNDQSETAAVFRISDLGIVSRIVGIGILIFSATGIFGQLQFSLNRIWEVAPDPDQGGILPLVLKRLFSCIMVVALGAILLVSLVLTAMSDQMLLLINGRTPDFVQQTLGLVLNEAGALVIAILLFGSMFRILPDAKLYWKDVWLGAIATAVLFVIGKALIGWYLRTSAVGSSWGAAASSFATLVWVYYTSMIVLFGAELTRAWATRDGRTYEPSRGAVRVIKETRHVK